MTEPRRPSEERPVAQDLADWEAHRPHLLGLAYRMLGDRGRAEEVVQDAWLRWRGRTGEAETPRAYLVTLVTRLCLNELGSARARREESRSDRLPEPIDLADGLASLDALDRISMAFLVVLQRLTPAERAVLLLHDVFEFDHASIGKLVGKTAPASRKLLERARAHVANEKRVLDPAPEQHARLLEAFARAASSGDLVGLVTVLAEDAVLVTDGGPDGRRAFGSRSLPEPLVGAELIAAFVGAVAGRASGVLTAETRTLNGEPALLMRHPNGEPFAVMQVAVADGRIHRVYFQADPARLARFAPKADR